jgi:hypothetical protein
MKKFAHQMNNRRGGFNRVSRREPDPAFNNATYAAYLFDFSEDSEYDAIGSTQSVLRCQTTAHSPRLQDLIHSCGHKMSRAVAVVTFG